MIEQKLFDIKNLEYDFGGIDNGSYKLIKFLSNQNQKDKLPRYFNSCVKCKNAMWYLELNKDDFGVLNSYCRIMNAIKFNSLAKTETHSCAGLNS